MRLCLAIPTYNRDEVLVRTLEQAFAQERPADEIIVVDQTVQHDPETERFLREASEAGRLRWAHLEMPNLPSARNEAVRLTTCDVIVFIDDDVELPGPFLANHLRCYEDPEVHAVCGDYIQPEKPGGAIDPVHPWRFLGQWDITEKQPFVGLAGGNFSVRREAFVAVGGVDENFEGPAYYEEIDLAKRLSSAGYHIIADPSCFLIHLRVPSGGCRIGLRNRFQEWTKPISIIVFAHRHAESKERRRALYKQAARIAFMRKEIAIRPWLWPVAIGGFAYASIEGRRRAKAGVRSRLKPGP